MNNIIYNARKWSLHNTQYCVMHFLRWHAKKKLLCENSITEMDQIPYCDHREHALVSNGTAGAVDIREAKHAEPLSPHHYSTANSMKVNAACYLDKLVKLLSYKKKTCFWNGRLMMVTPFLIEIKNLKRICQQYSITRTLRFRTGKTIVSRFTY